MPLGVVFEGLGAALQLLYWLHQGYSDVALTGLAVGDAWVDGHLLLLQ